MITILTPTHARPKAFKLLEGYLKRQTYKGAVQWLVVCDAGFNDYEFNGPYQVFRRDTTNDPVDVHSICLNYSYLIPHIRGTKVLCIEDDDWYRPDYLQVMADALDRADMVGTAPAYYFHVMARRWRNLRNVEHCSLAQTGFTLKALPCFAQCCGLKKCVYIDAAMWAHYRQQGSQLILPNDFDKPIHVGIKGLPSGARGLGLGHDSQQGNRDIGMLKKWIGKDFANYYGPGNVAL